MELITKSGVTVATENPVLIEQYLKHGAVEVTNTAAPKKKKVIEDKIRD